MNLIPSILFLRSKHKHIWLNLWPPSTCNNHPKTLSFRATTHQDLLFIENPDNNNDPVVIEPELGSCRFTNSSETTASVSTDSDHSAVETIVRGACRPQRLFFEPDSSTSSILETTTGNRQCPQCPTLSEIGGGGMVDKESVAVVIESVNPYVDFKKSMEEMVENIHGLKDDWDCLEELLEWYLRVNDKNNHDFIVGAFVDLLAGISGGCHRRHGGGGGGGGGGGVSFLDHTVASFGSSAASTLSSPSSSFKDN